MTRIPPAGLLVAAPLLAPLTCRGPAQPTWAGLLEGRPCAAEASALLEEWGAGGEVLRAPPPPEIEARFRVATASLGDWVLIDLPRTGAPGLSHVEPSGVERAGFEEGCAIRRSREEVRRPGGAAVFTDADLRAALQDPGGGLSAATVLYLWSPHMPLSVDGYAEIRTACDDLALNLVPLLVPGGDTGFARREAERVGIPSEGLREAASVELAMRDAYVHAPTILVFASEGASPVLPGYRDAAGYRRFLAGTRTVGGGGSAPDP